MPTVSVGRDRLHAALGKTYTQQEFEALCFEFGIELDDVTTEKAIERKEKHIDGAAAAAAASDDDEEVIYKIEVAANRYDLLCLEGIARALRIFTGSNEVPDYRLSDIPRGSMLEMHVKPETKSIRPFVVCAVLRGVTFDEARFKSFIDLQDKLHQNLCRKRSLVAIGTHDLDTLQGPFTYEALSPKEINFVPLKQDRSFRADELLEHYRVSDSTLNKFLHIIENSPLYPVIYDKNRTVLSLPPIINGAHSAITLETKNVFIECTATDLTKANIVLNTMVTMFSEYCQNKFEVEPVVVHSDGKANIYPDLSVFTLEVPLSDIIGRTGISKLGVSEAVHLLDKMQLRAKQSSLSDGRCSIVVTVPPTRSDILHICDVIEDVGIAYNYDNIPETKPRCETTGRQQPLNLFSDMIRKKVYGAGYMEVLTWILCSHKENSEMLNQKAGGEKAVVISDSRTSEFQEVRTSLMSGLLKTIMYNSKHPKPIKIFEVGDVVTLDVANDVGAANNRRMAALCCGSVSCLGDILGLVESIMKAVKASDAPDNHELRPSDEPEFLQKLQANIIFKGEVIGILGDVHPEVLKNFGISDPCSFVELNIQALL